MRSVKRLYLKKYSGVRKPDFVLYITSVANGRIRRVKRIIILLQRFDGPPSLTNWMQVTIWRVNSSQCTQNRWHGIFHTINTFLRALKSSYFRCVRLKKALCYFAIGTHKDSRRQHSRRPLWLDVTRICIRNVREPAFVNRPEVLLFLWLNLLVLHRLDGRRLQQPHRKNDRPRVEEEWMQSNSIKIHT